MIDFYEVFPDEEETDDSWEEEYLTREEKLLNAARYNLGDDPASDYGLVCC